MPIHPDYAAFVSDARNTVRPPPAHLSMSRIRAAADAAMYDPEPVAVHRIRDLVTTAGSRTIPLRLYCPESCGPLPVIVFVHGGGFVWGSIDTHDGICRRLCSASGAAVVSVGYRLAPETRYPGAVLDVLAALSDLRFRATQLGLDMDRYALCGDSAGGNLALAATAQELLDRRRPSHLGLIYPAVDPGCDSDSHHTFHEGPVLTRAAMKWFWSCYLDGSATDETIIHSPLQAHLTGFPPTWIGTAEIDPLRDEGEALARHLAASGVTVEVQRYRGAVHGFLSLAVGTDLRDMCIRDLAQAQRTAFLVQSCS
jgi:acetyl esterase